MLTSEQFVVYLREALNHLYEPDRLRHSPLATLFGVANRPDTPSALRRILVEAIEALDPGPDEPTSSRAWQIYAALLYRFVEQLGQPEVADQLGMSVRHLRRKESEAIHILANRLWERFSLDVAMDVMEQKPGGDQPAGTDLMVNDELAWLRESQRWGPTDLQVTLPRVLDLAKGLAERHHATLETAIADALPQVAADPVAVRLILLSLLSVAIPRATSGRVVLAVQPQRWEVEFRVLCSHYPTGPKPALADETASLTMAQRLADVSSGSLELAVDARSFDARLLLPAVEQSPVLLVDDNVETHHLLQRYVTGTPYRLVCTREAEQAERLAAEISPQAIILDVMMPNVDGWELLARLRQNPQTGNIPVIVCTILAQKELAEHLGANAFLRKPVTREAFLSVLHQQVRHAERVER